MSELAAVGISVVELCRVLNLARMPYHRWLRNFVSMRELEEAYRPIALLDSYREDPEIEYRLLAGEARDECQTTSDRTNWPFASGNSWWSLLVKMRSENGTKPLPGVHDDRCVVIDEHWREYHRFEASRPNPHLPDHITEHNTTEGKRYLCAVNDTFRGRTLGYLIGPRLKALLAVRADHNAAWMRGNVNSCIVRSSRGSQSRDRKLRREPIPNRRRFGR